MNLTMLISKNWTCVCGEYLIFPARVRGKPQEPSPSLGCERGVRKSEEPQYLVCSLVILPPLQAGPRIATILSSAPTCSWPCTVSCCLCGLCCGFRRTLGSPGTPSPAWEACFQGCFLGIVCVGKGTTEQAADSTAVPAQPSHGSSYVAQLLAS